MKGNVEPARLSKIVQCMRLKQESFEDMAAAVREHDDTLAQKSIQEAEEAGKIDKELNEEDENEP